MRIHTVVTDALVLKRQAISIQSGDQVITMLDQFYMKTTLELIKKLEELKLHNCCLTKKMHNCYLKKKCITAI